MSKRRGKQLTGALIWVLCFSMGFTPALRAAAPDKSQSWATPLVGVTQGEGHAPEDAPDSIDELIARVNSSQSEGEYGPNRLELISTPHIEVARQQFLVEAAFTGSSMEDRAAFQMFQQWLYLEVYRTLRLEFMLHAISRAILLKASAPLHGERWTPERSLQAFDRLLPEQWFDPYPRVLDERKNTRDQLENSLRDRNQLLISKEFTLGVIESSFLSLSVLKRKREFLEDRFSPNDDRYIKQAQEMDEWEGAILRSNPILHSDAFEDLLDDVEEVADTQKLMEAATNRFRTRFARYMDDHRSIKNLMDYLQSEEIVDFGKDMQRALELDTQVEFRKKIHQAFPHGIEEVYQSAIQSSHIYRDQVLGRDTVKDLVLSNVRTAQDIGGFQDWLSQIFTTNALHWLITQDHPYLKAAAKTLTQLVIQGHSNRRWDQYKKFALFGLFSLGMWGSNRGTQSAKAMSVLAPFFRGLFLTGQVAISVSLFADFYENYKNWRRIHHLARMNPDGMGLTSILQEEQAYTNARFKLLMAGATLLSTTVEGWYSIRTPPSINFGKIRPFRIVQRSFARKPIPPGVYTRRLGQAVKELKKAGGIKNKAALWKFAKASSLEIASLATHWALMPTWFIPQVVKTGMGKVSAALSQGLTLGVVLAIMGVTVQHIISAWGLKVIIWAMKNVGYTPPLFWQMNALNSEERFVRNQAIRIWVELNWTKQFIHQMVNSIDMYEAWLRNDPDLDAETTAHYKAMIKENYGLIRNHLQTELLRWYEFYETRDLNTSIMKRLGYGIFYAPSYSDPQIMRLALRVGDRVFDAELTARDSKNMKVSRVIRDVDITMEDIEEFERFVGLK